MRRLTLSLFLCALCLVLLPVPSPAAEVPGALAGESEAEAYDAWMSLFRHREQTLKAILDKAALPDRDLNRLLQELSREADSVSDAYQELLAARQLSRGLPLELGLILDQMQRLKERLEESMRPLAALQAAASSGTEDLVHLDVNLEGAVEKVRNSPQALAFASRLKQARQELSDLNVRLQYALSPARNLRDQMTREEDSIKAGLPGMWKRYYLSAADRIFDPDGWKRIRQAVATFGVTFSMRMEAQIPHTLRDIVPAALRAAVVLAFLGGLTLLLRNSAAGLTGTLRQDLDRLVRRSLPLLYAGVALYVAAWAPKGNPYQLLVVAGTVLLSLGQMRLAWSIRLFTWPDAPARSPLRVIFLPLLSGLILLFFNLPPEPLGFLWLVTLGGCLWFESRHRAPENTPSLEKHLLAAHKVVLWILLGVTLAGWGRLSVLFCTVYAMIAICLQQAVGFVQLSNHLSDKMPQTGMRDLLRGVVLALAVPALIVVFSLSMGLWILAYPGGDYLLEQVTRADIHLGERSLNFIQVLLILSAFYITRSAIEVGRFFLRQLPSQGVRIDQTLIPPFQLIYTYVLWALFAMFSLRALGFSLTSLTVVAGGLSVGVGFGMQSIVNNFVSGLLLIFGQNIREGDIIEVSGLMGTVRKIAIRSTTLETFDNSTVFIPNANLLTNNLVNWTRNGRMVRRTINVGVAYGSDVRQVLELLRQIAADHPQVYKQPAPLITFADFADSTLNFSLRVWIDITQESSALTDLRLNINDAFAAHGINIAFPQLDVHFPDGAPRAARTS